MKDSKESETPETSFTTNEDDVDILTVSLSEVGKDSELCVVKNCQEPRCVSKYGGKMITFYATHANDHREKCRTSYQKKLKRESAINNCKISMDELKQSVTDKTIYIRKLQKKLQYLQKDHDQFVASVTGNLEAGSELESRTVISVLRTLHAGVSELTMNFEAEESHKMRYIKLQTAFDELREKYEQLVLANVG